MREDRVRSVEGLRWEKGALQGRIADLIAQMNKGVVIVSEQEAMYSNQWKWTMLEGWITHTHGSGGKCLGMLYLISPTDKCRSPL
jgi:hypothetical protein